MLCWRVEFLLRCLSCCATAASIFFFRSREWKKRKIYLTKLLAGRIPTPRTKTLHSRDFWIILLASFDSIRLLLENSRRRRRERRLTKWPAIWSGLVSSGGLTPRRTTLETATWLPPEQVWAPLSTTTQMMKIFSMQRQDGTYECRYLRCAYFLDHEH